MDLNTLRICYLLRLLHRLLPILLILHFFLFFYYVMRPFSRLWLFKTSSWKESFLLLLRLPTHFYHAFIQAPQYIPVPHYGFKEVQLFFLLIFSMCSLCWYLHSFASCTDNGYMNKACSGNGAQPFRISLVYNMKGAGSINEFWISIAMKVCVILPKHDASFFVLKS